MIEILTCPFCGSDPEPKMKSFDGSAIYWLKCSNNECPLSFANEKQFSGTNAEEVIEKWNTRKECGIFNGARRRIYYNPGFR